MNTLNAAELRREISHKVKTGNGTAYVTDGLTMPDDLISELFDEVREARERFEATAEDARKLRAKLNTATAARSAHKNDEDAVYTSDPGLGLVFSDARGVALQNAVKAAEKELNANGVRSKAALLDYLVLALQRQNDVKDEALARALEADAKARTAAALLHVALADREKFWALAGQPFPGVEDESGAAYRRVLLQHQRQMDLKKAVELALPFPLKQEAGN
jgi:hypothetical protein